MSVVLHWIFSGHVLGPLQSYIALFGLFRILHTLKTSSEVVRLGKRDISKIVGSEMYL